MTYALMAVNLAVFLWIGIREPDSLSSRQMTRDQADLSLSEYSIAIDDEWYRLITSGFLHFGIIHIAFNMLLLFQLGQMLEPILGRVRFALLYFAALLGGSAGVMLLNQNVLEQHGGASGAVFGLLGAAAGLLLQRGVNPLTTGIGTTLMLNLLITFSIPGISIGGHIGGVVAGAAAGWFMLAPKGRGAPQWLTYASPVIVAAISIAVSMLVANSSDAVPFFRR